MEKKLYIVLLMYISLAYSSVSLPVKTSTEVNDVLSEISYHSIMVKPKRFYVVHLSAKYMWRRGGINTT